MISLCSDLIAADYPTECEFTANVDFKKILNSNSVPFFI